MTNNYLYKRTLRINDKINIYIPTVGEIIDNEDSYYNLISILTAMPIDFMVQLDDAGIDFTSINEYELFLLLFVGLQSQDTSLIFQDLDLTKFRFDENPENGMMTVFDEENGIRIDRAIHNQISTVLRKIHHFEKNRRKPANKEAKEYLLKRAREKLKRKRYRHEDSQLESLIIALVNTEQFKYNFEEVRELSIYQFNESVRQIVKKVDYDNRMYGIYAGTVNPKEFSQDDLNWLVHK